jgi:hypothetical protein
MKIGKQKYLGWVAVHLLHLLVAGGLLFLVVSNRDAMREWPLLQGQTRQLCDQTMPHLFKFQKYLRNIIYQVVESYPARRNTDPWIALKKMEQSFDQIIADKKWQRRIRFQSELATKFTSDYKHLMHFAPRSMLNEKELSDNWLQPKFKTRNKRLAFKQYDMHLGLTKVLFYDKVATAIRGTDFYIGSRFFTPQLNVLNPKKGQKVNCKIFYRSVYLRPAEYSIWINDEAIPFVQNYPIHCTQSPLQPIYIRMEYEDPVTEVLVSQVDTFYLNVTK